MQTLTHRSNGIALIFQPIINYCFEVFRQYCMLPTLKSITGLGIGDILRRAS